MKPINPSGIYFIKLGSGGEWEERCVEQEQTIRLGFSDANHADCLAGNWEKIRQSYLTSRTAGKATEFANQIKLFYARDAKTVWVTFYANHMWWCFADEKVVRQPDGTKIRKVAGQWSNKDIAGSPLSLDSLSGKLTQVRGFRGTICRIKEQQYAIDRINGKLSPFVSIAMEAEKALAKSLLPLIQNLTWGDFEILVDLVFSQAGWQRVGVLGKTEKDWDLDLLAPVTGERALVQVKSRSDVKEFHEYVNEFRQLKQHSRLFYVAHSITGDSPSSEPSVNFVGPAELAKLVVNAGLSAWLIKKNS